MERDVIRLECLKLRMGLDRTVSEVISSAKAFEDYIVGALEDTKTEKVKKPSHKNSE